MTTKDRVYLREWRLAKGLNQPELAARTGTVKSEISRLEKGSRKMTLEWMSRFAQALGISVDDLMTVPPIGFGAVSPPPDQKSGDNTNFAIGKLGEIDVGVRRSDYSIVTISGDDWSGIFAPGDLLIYDITKRSTAVPGLFAIEAGGETMIRRVTPSDNGAVLTCANVAYPAVALSNDHKVAGRVVARVHRV